MKIVRFITYDYNTQKYRLQLFASYAYGNVLDIGYYQLPNIYFKQNPYVKKVCGLDVINPKHPPIGYDEVKVCNLNREGIPYPSQYFDTVIAGEIIEHLHNPDFLIKECYRVLKKNGILILSTPSPKYYLEIISRKVNIRLVKEHINLFDRLHMKNMLTKAKLHVIAILSYEGWIPLLKIGIICFRLPEFLSWKQIYIAKKIVRG
jgi:SAM-dependent methyltransferase